MLTSLTDCVADMSKVISFRLNGERLERLNRVARSMNRTPGEAAAILVEESLREREFPGLVFRDTGIGRQAFLRDTRLAVWHIISAATSVGQDVQALSVHFGVSPIDIATALSYARTYQDEIDAAIRDNDAAFGRFAAQQPPEHVITV